MMSASMPILRIVMVLLFLTCCEGRRGNKPRQTESQNTAPATQEPVAAPKGATAIQDSSGSFELTEDAWSEKMRGDDPSITPEQVKVRDAFERKYPSETVFLRWNGPCCGWAVCAKKHLKPGDVTIDFKHAEGMTSQAGKKLATGRNKKLQEIKFPGFSKDTLGVEMRDLYFLTLLLLVERRKGAASHWAEYLALLPKIPPVLLTHMSDAEVACLPKYMRDLRAFMQGVEATMLQGLAAAAHHTDLLPEGPPTQEESNYVVSLMFTRGSQRKAPWHMAMYPWFSNTNHNAEGNVVLDTKQHSAPGWRGWDGLVSVAAQNIRPGEEIGAPYSDLSFQEAFMRYGFIMPKPELISLEAFGSQEHVDKSDPCNMENMTPAQLCLRDLVDNNFRPPKLWIKGLKCVRGHPTQSLEQHLRQCARSRGAMKTELTKRVMKTLSIYEGLAGQPQCRGSTGHLKHIRSYTTTMIKELKSVVEELMVDKDEGAILAQKLDKDQCKYVDGGCKVAGSGWFRL